MHRLPQLALPFGLLLTPLCHAGTALPPGYEVVTHTVKYADLNLERHEAAVTLYERIRSAAEDVCAVPASSRMLELFSRRLECEQQAVKRAVEEVNSPQLTEVHRARTHPLAHMALTNQVLVAMVRP